MTGRVEMEGSGGHTKECKVRTTTSANPLLATTPPFLRFIRPHPRQPAPPPPPSSPPPPSAYRSPLPEVTTHYHTRRPSPRLPLIVFHPPSPVSHPLSSRPPSSVFQLARFCSTTRDPAVPLFETRRVPPRRIAITC